ncbi:protein TonB [Rhodoligotrophos appendicifer]|uniref:energy transducer TonB n=1 Tax=Rhodoligotrophos appendicifer TaxID=987056 RepID=UPI001186B9E5|nr:energy transducer TonB [Rhodoligotrophos appendicifer]
MNRNASRWIIGFAGAVAMHATVLGMVPWPKDVALSERSAGEDADVWGAPSNTIMMELATVETVAGATENTAEVTEPNEADTAEQPDSAEQPDAVETQRLAAVAPEMIQPTDTPKPIEEVEPPRPAAVEPRPAEVEAREVAPLAPVAAGGELQAVEPTPSENTEPQEIAAVEPAEIAEAEPTEVAAVDPATPVDPVTPPVTEAEPTELVPIPQTKPDVVEVEPEPIKKIEPKKERKTAPPKPAKAKTARAKQPSPDKAPAGTASKSAAAASGQARGTRGVREAEAGQADRSNYAGRILAHLQRHKHFPDAAARSRMSGTVTLTFAISANGHLRSVKLRRGSGYEVLDDAALSTVRRAEPFPPIPSDLGQTAMTFTVPLRYKRQ